LKKYSFFKEKLKFSFFEESKEKRKSRSSEQEIVHNRGTEISRANLPKEDPKLKDEPSKKHCNMLLFKEAQ